MMESDNGIDDKIDDWYLNLKKHLISEFDKLRLQYLEETRRNSLNEQEIQNKEYIDLTQDINTIRTMLTQHEHIVDQKKQTVKNLYKALHLLYHKTILYRYYYEWRIIYAEKKREKYSLLLAQRFYQKVLLNWKHLIEHEWKLKFKLECEKRSKALYNDFRKHYEIKYKQLELKLLNANEEITRLKSNKNQQHQPLKSAFLRGICALNMEAMGVLFRDDESDMATVINERHRDNEDSTFEYSSDDHR